LHIQLITQHGTIFDTSRLLKRGFFVSWNRLIFKSPIKYVTDRLLDTDIWLFQQFNFVIRSRGGLRLDIAKLTHLVKFTSRIKLNCCSNIISVFILSNKPCTRNRWHSNHIPYITNSDTFKCSFCLDFTWWWQYMELCSNYLNYLNFTDIWFSSINSCKRSSTA
jgi:hypothetical protein